MSITLRRNPTDLLVELGGGACPLVRPNVDVRPCQDAQGNSTVDIVADFEKPLPLETEKYDGVFSQFCLEHISYPKIPSVPSEAFRI